MCYTKHVVCLPGKLTKIGSGEARFEQDEWFLDDASQFLIRGSSCHALA